MRRHLPRRQKQNRLECSDPCKSIRVRKIRLQEWVQKTVDFSRIDFGNTVDSVGSEIAIHGAGEEHGEFPHNVLVVDTRAASIEIGPAARKNLPDRGSC